jgi:hypothetical protein
MEVSGKVQDPAALPPGIELPYNHWIGASEPVWTGGEETNFCLCWESKPSTAAGGLVSISSELSSLLSTENKLFIQGKTWRVIQ